MAGRGGGRHSRCGGAGELGLDERSTPVLAAGQPEGDEGNLQLVGAVLVFVRHDDQPQNLNGLLVPKNKSSIRSNTVHSYETAAKQKLPVPECEISYSTSSIKPII